MQKKPQKRLQSLICGAHAIMIGLKIQNSGKQSKKMKKKTENAVNEHKEENKMDHTPDQSLCKASTARQNMAARTKCILKDVQSMC